MRRRAVGAAAALALLVGAGPAAAPEAVTTDELREQLAKERRSWDRQAAKYRRELRRARSRAAIVSPLRGVLARIAQCESGGDPRAVSAGGTYRGKYQFDRQTWASVGGRGDPAAAPEAEQDKRAAILYERRGPQPWPVCG